MLYWTPIFRSTSLAEAVRQTSLAEAVRQTSLAEAVRQTSLADAARQTSLAIALSVALCAQAAAATDASAAQTDQQDQPGTLDAIQVTATRRSESSAEVPQAVTVLDSNALAKRSGQTNADLLHGEVGTFVQQTTPGQAVIIIRGLKGSEVLHLVDGFRLNNAFFRNAPNQYPALVDPLMIEQLEVVRGPSSVLYGSDAMGGVVQMLSGLPRYASSDEVELRGRVRTRYGSADQSSISRSEVALSSERFFARAGGTYQNVGELKIGGGRTLPFTEYSARFADATLGWNLSDQHELLFSAQFARQPKTPRFDELVPGFGQLRPTSSDFLFKPQERRFAQLRYSLSYSNPLFDDARFALGRQDIIDDRLSRDFGSSNLDLEQNASELIGLTAQFEKSFEQHYLTYGFERYEDRVDSARIRRSTVSGLVSTRPSRYPNGSTVNSFGLYVADDWRVSERLDLNAGLRYSRFDIELPTINNIGVQLDPAKVTGNAGFNFELHAGLNLVGNYGRGFRAPNVFDLGTFGARPGNRFNVPNPNLKPETVDSVDFGVKFSGERWQADWQGELIAYKSRYQDKISSLETGERNTNNQILVQNVNATALDLHGLEAGLRFHYDRWNAFATATLTRGAEEFASERFDADRIPPLFGKFGVDYRYSDALSFSGYSLYAARQDRLSPRDRTDPRINPAGTAGYGTFNLAADWQVNSALSLRLSLENLADKQYREHGTGLDEAGRNIGVALDWAWD